jgi:hypothetical protein
MCLSEFLIDSEDFMPDYRMQWEMMMLHSEPREMLPRIKAIDSAHHARQARQIRIRLLRPGRHLSLVAVDSIS